MKAHGFTIAALDPDPRRPRDGHATAYEGRARRMEVTTLRITNEGLRALGAK